MKRLVCGIFLLGCASAPPDKGLTPSPTAIVTIASSTPAATKAPEKSPGEVSEDDVLKMAQLHVEQGMTNQARIDLLMVHLAMNGKKRLLCNWDVEPLAQGDYEVSYTVSTMTKATPTPSPQDTKTPVGRTDPFARPARPKPPADALIYTWTVNPAKGTFVPKDERTRSLVALQPQLDSTNLEATLPDKWRGAAPAEVAQAPESEPSAAPVNTPSPKPEASLKAKPRQKTKHNGKEVEVQPDPQPADEETPQPVEEGTPVATQEEAKHEDPIKFEGFIGEGKERRAILSKGSEHYSLAVGDKFSGFQVKSLNEDELVLQRGSDTLRLTPGQAWEPFLSPGSK